MQRLAYRILSICSAITLVATLWVWMQNPFAAPLIARSEAGAQAILTKAIARRVTPDWAILRLEAALAAGDYDEMQLILDIALDHGIALPRELLERMAEFAAKAEGPLAAAADCATCAYDISTCERIAQMASCALPIEMTPLGDMNALRRAGFAYATGGEVDRLDAGLALVGLGATGLAVFTGGSTLSIKVGASLLRSGRRMGALSASFTALLFRKADDIEIKWSQLPNYALGRADLKDVADPAKLADLGHLAGDMGAIRTATSTGEALVLMRYVDTAADARAMAKLASVQGSKTRATMRVLGKSRAFRALVRLSDLALGALALLMALFLQFLALLSETLRISLRPRNGPVAKTR
ncbi:MAG: hypothetical protein ACJA06_001150 [Halocynthiibacter sp.]|jgi:hypothetical protein